MKKILFSLFVLANIFILCSFSFINYWIEKNGKEITVETKPVDPKDLFYGEYVYLSYEIEEVPKKLYEGEKLSSGNIVCVELTPKDGVYEIKKVTEKCPENVEKENVVLKGKHVFTFENKMHIDYGIHRYYVKEGEAKQFERGGNKEIRYATILISPLGQAKVVQIHQ
ncbi:MAG TPA: GDYXXLXY domain-containing protein [Massilibacterium sp.]|nr:GDYXXLXY domain-containing protein [Massilibacterium sp.]